MVDKQFLKSTDSQKCFFLCSAELENSETDSLGGVKVKMAESPTKSRKPRGREKDNQSRLQERPK